LASLLPTPGAVPLRVTSTLLGIPVALFQIYSVVHQLRVFDQAVNLRVIEANDVDIESLARVSEVVSIRAEYVEQITPMMVKEIGMMVAAGKWADVKQALHVRGYFADLETLLEN